jgi:hypothetical protein
MELTRNYFPQEINKTGVIYTTFRNNYFSIARGAIAYAVN